MDLGSRTVPKDDLTARSSGGEFDAGEETPSLGAKNQVIRVGLLIDSFRQPVWVAQMLEECQRVAGVEFVLVVQNTAPGEEKRGRLRAWVRNRNLLLYALYRRIDDRRLRQMKNPFEEVDLSPVLGELPTLNVVPRQTRFSDFVSDEDVERIRTYQPDVLLRLGFRILQGPILGLPRFGVWSYHHGDNRVNRGGPAGIWESLMGGEVTGSTLQVITSDLDGGRAILRGTFATQRGSAAANRARLYWRSCHFVASKLRELVEQGPGRALAPVDGAELPTYSQPLFRAPTNIQMLGLWARQAVRRVRGAVTHRLGRNQWFMAYRFGAENAAMPDLAPFRFRELIPPADRIWADPFPVSRDGRHFVLFEELLFGKPKGRISAIELGPKGPLGPPRVVLEEKHHVSYPFVIQWEGGDYLIPEAAASGKISYYRAVEFPYRWELAGTLIDEALVDATIAQVGDRWWMFASPKTAESDSDELVIYFADTPLGPWRPHRCNPVKSTALGSRPAGRLFQHGGSWHRPAQVCAPGYGKAIRFFRIDQLDDQEFREQEVGELTPDWRVGLTGIHTINFDRGLTLIDARQRISRVSRRLRLSAGLGALVAVATAILVAILEGAELLVVPESLMWLVALLPDG